MSHSRRISREGLTYLLSASAWMISVISSSAIGQVSPERLAPSSAKITPTLSARSLERLFHTADERRALDRGKSVAPPRALPRPVAPFAPVASREPRVTGFVRRTDGVDTLFIDHKRSRHLANDNPELLQPKAVGRGLANAREIVAK